MKLRDQLATKTFQLRVKQHRAVLDFTTTLEDAMGEAGITQQQLATALNKSRAWISKVFRKKPNLTFFTAVELADALGFDFKVSLNESGGLVATHQASSVGSGIATFAFSAEEACARPSRAVEVRQVDNVYFTTFSPAPTNELHVTSVRDVFCLQEVP